MTYSDLNELISKSSSSRKYFLSLSPSMQMKLHRHNDYIHSARQLHLRKDEIEKYDRAVEISKSLF